MNHESSEADGVSLSAILGETFGDRCGKQKPAEAAVGSQSGAIQRKQEVEDQTPLQVCGGPAQGSVRWPSLNASRAQPRRRPEGQQGVGSAGTLSP